MTTNFPTSLDSLVNPDASAGDKLSGTGPGGINTTHDKQHQNANDAIEAIQAKVGVNSSADSASLDYKVANLPILGGTPADMVIGSVHTAGASNKSAPELHVHGLTAQGDDCKTLIAASGDLSTLTFPFVLPLGFAAFNFTMIALKVLVLGGTNAVINVGKGPITAPTNKLYTADKTVTSGTGFADVPTLNGTTAYSAADPIWGIITSVSGAPTMISFAYIFSVP